MEVFEQTCRSVGAAYRPCDFSALHTLENTLEGQRFDYRDFRNLHTSLLGLHQEKNAALAAEVILALRERGWNIPDEAVRTGLSSARWPGRFEVLSRSPWFIVDGGHNPQCAQAAAEALELYFPGRKIVFFCSVSWPTRTMLVSPISLPLWPPALSP